MRKGYLYLILYSVLTGSVGVAVRFTQGMNAYGITFFRAGIGVVFMFLLISLSRKLHELKPQNYIKTLLVGLVQGASLVMYMAAIQKTAIANAMFLLYTAPIFSLFFAKLFFKEKIQHVTIIGIIATIIGIILLLDPTKMGLNPENTIGNLLGLGSGLGFALMGMISKSLRKTATGNYLALWQYLIIACMLLFFISGSDFRLAANNIGVLLFLGIFTCGIAFTLFMKGIGSVEAQKIFIITSLEPVVGTLLGMAFFKEIPSLLSFLGIALIFFGVYFVTTRQAAGAHANAHELS